MNLQPIRGTGKCLVIKNISLNLNEIKIKFILPLCCWVELRRRAELYVATLPNDTKVTGAKITISMKVFLISLLCSFATIQVLSQNEEAIDFIRVTTGFTDEEDVELASFAYTHCSTSADDAGNGRGYGYILENLHSNRKIYVRFSFTWEKKVVDGRDRTNDSGNLWSFVTILPGQKIWIYCYNRKYTDTKNGYHYVESTHNSEPTITEASFKE